MRGTSNPTKVAMVFAKILLIIILFVFAEKIIFGNGPGALWAYIYVLATEPVLIYKYRQTHDMEASALGFLGA